MVGVVGAAQVGSCACTEGGGSRRQSPKDMQVCTLDDPSYPSLLRELTDAPPVLFWRGTWPALERWSRSLAVVRTRNCTADMARAAHEVAGDWSLAGGTVVSGLARGIDGQAHRGVLEGPRPHALGHQAS